ncbi:Hypothetical predicted protein [Mytilus galloprovincialis]|uniref:B box-type domain-containing protein n=1 Tax=Mytilus galloprovincialis TaxID=29158 RepID=A0A8B6EII9_MYTGA|nr:Hypothetical predicted protein [Mytilus galloprovincialis]
MGSSPSLAQPQSPAQARSQAQPRAQCPVEPVKQAQIPIGCKCGNPKVKWRCENCVSMLCDMCQDKDHAAKGHHIIDITTIQVKISDVKTYQTKVERSFCLEVAPDNSLWIGDGDEKEGFHPFTSPSALQNVKLVGDKVKVISSFNINVFGVAVTPSNDILLATFQPRLKQIKAGSKKLTDSIYCEDMSNLAIVHVTKDDRVIVSVDNAVVVMDTDGNHLTRYEKDENNKQVFSHFATSINSTINGNIFVAGYYDRKVVVFGKTDIISIYRGHHSFNNEYTGNESTPMDNVIVADSQNHALHILNNTGHLLTTYNTKDIGIPILEHLAITKEGSFTVLYMTSSRSNLYKMVITGC